MIDWDVCSIRYQANCMLLDDFHVPSKSLLDRHVAHILTGGQVETLFSEKTNYTDYMLKPGDREWMQRAWSLEEEIRKSLKRGDDGAPAKPHDWRIVIQNALSLRVASAEFVKAQSHMEDLSARLDQLIEQNEGAFERFKIGAAGCASTNNLARQCWFAHWLHYRGAVEDDRRRQLAEQEFHSFCLKLYRGFYHLPVKNKIYDRMWFAKVLNANRARSRTRIWHENIDLSPSIYKLKTEKLRDLLAHPYLKPDVLPPLNPAGFTRLSTEP